MMRAFFLAALFFTLVYITVAIVFANKVDSYRWESLFNYDYSSSYGSSSYDSYNSYNSYDSSSMYDDMAESATRTGAVICLLFLMMFETVFLFALLRIKTKTMKIMSIIGMSLTFIWIVIAFLCIANPGNMSFDEVGRAFAGFGLVLLAFNIVGTIHAFKTKS